MKKFIKGLIKTNNGQSVVEMAIVMPLLLVLILGMVEFGWILNGQITLTSAAREGARVAVIYESAAEATNAVQSAVLASAGSSSLKNLSTTTEFTNEQRAIVRVSAKITPIIKLFVTTDMLLNAKAEMRIE